MKTSVYLDYNATSLPRPGAKEEIARLLTLPLNASSVHAYGREGRRVIEKARAEVAALAGADPKNVIFNSGATEANNTVLSFFRGQRILCSAIEHPSILQGPCPVDAVPVGADGRVDLGALEDMLRREKTGLVSVMLVNNETGVVQPVAEVSALARRYGAMVHCDAVQAAGRIPVAIMELGVDFMSLSSHKIGGPQGCGALVMGMCAERPVLIYGGGQEKKARAGTENIAGIAGFGVAAREALEGLNDEQQRLSGLRDILEEEILRITPQAVFHGRDVARAANTSLFSLPGAKSETVMMALDLEGICVSNGSACSSGKVEASHVLKAMGVSSDLASSALRVSMGWGTVRADIDAFLAAWKICTARMGLVS